MNILRWITVVWLVLHSVDAVGGCTKTLKKYYFSKKRAYYEEAHKLCTKKGMRLASVQSEHERILYEDGLQLSGLGDSDKGHTWIAGKLEPGLPYFWQWNAGDGLVSRQTMNYTNWMPGLPNHRTYEKRLCVITSLQKHGWQWANCDCSLCVGHPVPRIPNMLPGNKTTQHDV